VFIVVVEMVFAEPPPAVWVVLDETMVVVKAPDALVVPEPLEFRSVWAWLVGATEAPAPT
jgi:hypothetical protein